MSEGRCPNQLVGSDGGLGIAENRSAIFRSHLSRFGLLLPWLAVATCAGATLPTSYGRADLMGMPSTATRWTAEMVRALPDDGNRYEVVDGVLLVTPSPRRLHQHAVLQLAKRLDDYVETVGVGAVLVSPSDIELDPHGMVQPDVFVEGLVDDRPAREWNAGAPLLLVVEVLSPGTARADRITKRDRYRRAGIPAYWIVDLDARAALREAAGL